MSDLWRVPGYTTQRVLRRGPGGILAAAVDDASGETVAIRYLGDLLRGDDAFRMAFRAEVRTLSGIDAPHLVRVFDYVEGPHGAAIVMEFVRGGTLLASLATHGPTEPESALAVLKNSLHGLTVAHRAGLAHGDYRPKAVLITLAGDCKLVNFGLVPRTGGRAGTFAYRPPTHLATGLAGPAGDIYAASATFVECLTGRTPVLGDDRTARLPVPVRDLARRGLSTGPDARPGDVGSYLERLESVAARGYGPRWEARARRQLAGRATMLAARPSHRADHSGAGQPDPLPERPTALRPGEGAQMLLGAASAVAVVVGLVAVSTFGGLDPRFPGSALPPTAAPPASRPVPPTLGPNLSPGSPIPTGPVPPAGAVPPAGGAGPGLPPTLLVVLTDGDDSSAEESRTTVIESPFPDTSGTARPTTPAGPLLAARTGPSVAPLLAVRSTPTGPRAAVSAPSPLRVGAEVPAVGPAPPSPSPSPPLRVEAEVPAVRPRSSPAPLKLEIPAVRPSVRVEADVPAVRPAPTARREPAARSPRCRVAPRVEKLVRRGAGITLGSRDRDKRKSAGDHKSKSKGREGGDRGGSKGKPKISIRLRLGG